MKLLLDQELVKLNGEVIKDAKNVSATLRSTAIGALLATYKGEENLTGAEKLKRWELAVKLNTLSDPADVTVDEVTLVKQLIGKAYGPLVVGQTWKMLEGE